MPQDNIYSSIAPDITSTERTPDYTKRSEGYQAENSSALIKGAGDVLGMVVKAKDELFKDLITDEATARVDDVRDESIVQRKAAVNLNDPGVPEHLKASARELKKLDLARQQGNLRDSHYYAKLDYIARDLRMRNPGYREQIDNTISSLVGTNPANALVKHLGNEADALAKSSENSPEKEREKFVDANLAYIPEKYFTDKAKGIIWSKDQLQYAAANNKRAKAEVEFASSNVDLTQKTSKLAEDNVAKIHELKVHEVFTRTASNLTPILNKLIIEGPERMNDAQFKTSAIATIQGIKEKMAVEIAQLTAEGGVVGASGKKIKEINDTRLAMIDDLTKSVENGTLNLAAISFKAMLEGSQNAAMGIPAIRNAVTITKLLPPEVARSFLGFSGNAGATASAAQQLAEMHFKQRIVMGELSLSAATRQAKSQYQLPDAIVADMSKQTVDLLKNPNVPKETWDTLFKAVYGPEGDDTAILRSASNKESVRNIYNNWTSPSIYNAVKRKAEETGDQSYIKNYAKWTTQAAQVAFTRELGDIRDAGVSNRFMTVNWKDGRLVAEKLPGAPTPPRGGFSVDSMVEDWNRIYLRQINKVIENQTPIWKDGGLDPEKETAKLIGMNWAKLNEKQAGALDMFFGWIGRNTKEIIGEPKGKNIKETIQRFEPERVPGKGLTRADLDTPEKLDKFLAELNSYRSDLGDGYRQLSEDVEMMTSRNIEGLMGLDIPYTPGERESTNVEDVRDLGRLPLFGGNLRVRTPE